MCDRPVSVSTVIATGRRAGSAPHGPRAVAESFFGSMPSIRSWTACALALARFSATVSPAAIAFCISCEAAACACVYCCIVFGSDIAFIMRDCPSPSRICSSFRHWTSKHDFQLSRALRFASISLSCFWCNCDSWSLIACWRAASLSRSSILEATRANPLKSLESWSSVSSTPCTRGDTWSSAPVAFSTAFSVAFLRSEPNCAAAGAGIATTVAHSSAVKWIRRICGLGMRTVSTARGRRKISLGGATRH